MIWVVGQAEFKKLTDVYTSESSYDESCRQIRGKLFSSAFLPQFTTTLQSLLSFDKIAVERLRFDKVLIWHGKVTVLQTIVEASPKPLNAKYCVSSVVGHFPDFLQLFDSSRCWYGWAFSDFLEKKQFRENENISDKSCPQFFAACCRFAGRARRASTPVMDIKVWASGSNKTWTFLVKWVSRSKLEFWPPRTKVVSSDTVHAHSVAHLAFVAGEDLFTRPRCELQLSGVGQWVVSCSHLPQLDGHKRHSQPCEIQVQAYADNKHNRQVPEPIKLFHI